MSNRPALSPAARLPHLVVIALSLSLLAIGSLAVLAPTAALAATGTVVTLNSAQIAVGGDAALTATLKTGDGAPVSDAALTLSVGGIRERERTNAAGVATFDLNEGLAAGSYSMTATFAGSRSLGLDPSSASSALQVVPAQIEIQTVPAIAGVGFNVTHANSTGSNPLTAISGADGIAHFSIASPGDYTARVTGLTGNSNIQAEFSRWGDDSFSEERTFTVGPAVKLQAGFLVSYLVAHDFVDADNAPVPPDRIGRVTVSNSLGQKMDLPPEPAWLVGQRAVRGRDGLEPVDVLYSVESVMIDGSNVVNRSEQRFYPRTVSYWSVPVRMYTLEVEAKDALFGRSTGSSFKLIYPDGHAQEFEFDDGNRKVIADLARGDYKIQVDSAVVAKTVPVSLTRNQTAEVSVVTIWNILAVAGGLAAIAIGLYVFGRSRIWTGLISGKGQTTPVRNE